MESSLPSRRVERVRHALVRRELTVTGVERLGPGFLAVTLAGEALDGFTSLSFDDHLKLIFPGPGGEVVRRDYTPRRFDAARRELTIEFALHGDGLASQWARQAAPGQQVSIGGPRGSMVIPADYDWHLLAGDGSALPAIHRRLEELPAGTRAFVIVQLPHPQDRRDLSSAAALQVQWVGDAPAWLQALRDFRAPPGEGFAWCAGEAALMARARALLLGEQGHPRAAARIAAYWKPGASEFHENLE